MDKDFWLYLEGYLMSERFETDRFLTDFSRAWSKAELDIDPPQYALNEANAYFKQQKQTATTITIADGAIHISASEGSDTLAMHGGTGYIPVNVDDIDELIAALQSVRTLLKPALAPTSSAHNTGPKSAPVPSQNELAARSLAPNIAGVKSRYELNIESMERALGLRK